MSTSETQIKIEDLGKLVHKKRKARKLTLEQVAEQTGVSASTLSRLERQHKYADAESITPDTRTITAVATWLGLSVEKFLSAGESQQIQKSTPDLVEAYLRADRKLDPDAAEKLGMMFRLAYDQFAKTNSEPTSKSNSENNE